MHVQACQVLGASIGTNRTTNPPTLAHHKEPLRGVHVVRMVCGSRSSSIVDHTDLHDM